MTHPVYFERSTVIWPPADMAAVELGRKRGQEHWRTGRRADEGGAPWAPRNRVVVASHVVDDASRGRSRRAMILASEAAPAEGARARARPGPLAAARPRTHRRWRRQRASVAAALRLTRPRRGSAPPPASVLLHPAAPPCPI